MTLQVLRMWMCQWKLSRVEHLQGFGVGFRPKCVRELILVEVYNRLRHSNRTLPSPGRVIVFALDCTSSTSYGQSTCCPGEQLTVKIACHLAPNLQSLWQVYA
jgi:hypothetical protein